MTVLELLDSANAVVVHRNWVEETERELTHFCQTNIPAIKATWKTDIRDLREIIKDAKLSCDQQDICFSFTELLAARIDLAAPVCRP